VAPRSHKSDGTLHEPGKDGFHSVPDFSDKDEDAMGTHPYRVHGPMRIQILEIEVTYAPEIFMARSGNSSWLRHS